MVAVSSTPAPKGATSGSGTGRNHLYALATRQDSEASPDVTGTLKLLSCDVCCLLDPESNLSYVAIHFGISFECIPDPFFVPPRWATLLWLEESIGVVW